MEPNSHLDHEVEEWRREWSHLPLLTRWYLGALLLIGACGGLVGAHTVILEFRTSWVAWVIGLAVLEPVGLASAMGLLVLLLPRSVVARWFVSSLKRAKLASVLVGLACIGAILWVLMFLIYGLWKMRS